MAVTRGQHLIGKKLGTCVLQRLLGYGGSSAVFLAQEQKPMRQVAIKVFLPRSYLDVRMQRDFYLRFLREAESASKLHHPNILPIYSYGEDDGRPYIVMPYMAGGTLAEYCKRHGPLSLQEVQWYLEQLSSALDYAHEQGCIHCDVKPANMLLDSEGHVLISDFGIARLTRTDDEEPQASELVLGTPDYVSPEQALGRPLDGRSDVYSLGVTIFFLLANSLPFAAETPIAQALLHVHEVPPSLALMRGDITPAIDRVVQKALAKDPDERYQSAGEFCAAFAAAVRLSMDHRAGASSGDGTWIHEDAPAVLKNTPLPGLAGLPIVRVKPVYKRRGFRWQPLIVVSACLLLVLSVLLTFRYVSAGSGPPVAVQTPTVTSLPNTPADLLADTDHWPTSDTFFFERGQKRYHIMNTSDENGVQAPYYAHQYQNFRLSVTMQKMQSGGMTPEYYGVIFRASPDQVHYYLFEIDPTEAGSYAFLRYNANAPGAQWSSILYGSAPSLAGRADQPNTVEVEARGNRFAFRINGVAAGKTAVDARQPALTMGQVGLYVENEGVEVTFSRFQISRL